LLESQAKFSRVPLVLFLSYFRNDPEIQGIKKYLFYLLHFIQAKTKIYFVDLEVDLLLLAMSMMAWENE